MESTAKDPVCGMTVRVAQAREQGLVTVHDGREFFFCRSGCKRAFEMEPDAYLQPAASGHGHAHGAAEASAGGAATATTTLPVIDAGMRQWYEACSCCLSDAFPEVKAALDEERRMEQAAPAGPGICEVAEGKV
ncbi:MAG TPA: YHS domain-containing protein [Candidatus Limnocylindrales bacterium]|nr:YHS domain-containing protein [Candidatus Limnocylindrales bacterium]